MSKVIKATQRGFTIIELLIATMVFSLILLLATYALLHVGNTYSKGTKLIAAQDTARSIIENISQAIQFNGMPLVPPPAVLGPPGTLYCFSIGSVRYTFVYDQKLTTTPGAHGLVWDDSNTPCAGAVSWPAPPFTELLGQRMRIAKLSITPAGGNLYNLTVRVIYGDDDLIVNDSCKSGAGSQFCAAAELSTVVQKRI
jgi:prepilin-type N-terminal cleavage/methylation domain-containing protein